MNRIRVATTIMDADWHMRSMILFVRIGASFFRGGWPHISECMFSTPSDCATGPSHMMFIQSICMGFMGFWRPRNVASATNANADKLVLSWKQRKFWMLWNMFLPSSMASNIESKANRCKLAMSPYSKTLFTTGLPKLSSTKTMSAASFATSVACFPIEIPISACRNAAASLTPSPVIPTTYPVD